MKLFCLFFFPSLLSAANPKIELLTELHPLEGKTEQIFLANRFWSVNSASNTIDVFDATAKKVESLSLPHSLTRIVPAGESHLVVFGKNQGPWRFYFTQIAVSDYTQKTFQFSEEADIFPDEFIVAENGDIFLADIPGRAVWKYQLGSDLHKLPMDIPVPTKMAIIGNFLYVVENFALASEKCNIVQINLATFESKRLFSSRLPGRITDLLLLNDGKTLAAPQVWEDRITLINTETGNLSELQISGNPRDVESYGNCLISASEETKTVSFFDWRKNQLLATWDLTPAGDRLKKPGKISVDGAHARIYARSAYPCFSCSATQSSIFVAEDAETFKACLE